MIEAPTRAGYVALLGRPNVGKSTLVNRLLAQKISITSPKPQTTRHTILAIKTLPGVQIVFVDTPGLHRNARRAMSRYLNRAAASALGYVNVVVMLVEALRWTDEDDNVVHRLRDFEGPVILAVNKIDRVATKSDLLPFLDRIKSRHEFAEIIPISALREDNLDTFEQLVIQRLPMSAFLFSEDQITTVSQRFVAAELIREKLTRHLREELPYALTVEIENFIEHERRLHISAVVWVERPGQKGIVIGEKGRTLKEIGRQARVDMEKIFACKVYLETWVKVREGWSDDERALRSLGYQEQH
jgi:GTP-binding protein Era